jgi:APA family basic amino acid/polyamine antiporter
MPAAGILVCGMLMLSLPLQTWGLALVWLVIGLGVYFTYSRHHSVLRAGR